MTNVATAEWAMGGEEEMRVRRHAGPSTQSLVHHCEVCGFYSKSKEMMQSEYVFRSEE